MGSVLSIRDAGVADAAAVAHLLGVLGYPAGVEAARARIARMAVDPGLALRVAERGGSVVGLIALQCYFYLPLGATCARIQAMAVDAGAQRGGIGRALVADAETWARAAGAVRIEVTSNKRRLGAHAFYRALGYEESSLRFLKALAPGA
jgi:GNAT superfamily N-acetyltransferase